MSRQSKEPDSPTVLVAEDDLEMRRLLAWSLERAGYRAVQCADGTTLMRKLGYMESGVPASRVALVVSDIKMPGLTGLDVLRSAHELGEAPPVILISAFADEEAYEQAQRLGAVALLAKPFDIEDLISKVHETIKAQPVPPEEPSPDLPFPVDVTFRHGSGLWEHEPVEEFIGQLASKLARFGSPIHRCHVVIDLLHGDTPARHAYLVRLVLSTPDKPTVAEYNARKSDGAGSLYLALRVVFGKASRSLKQSYDRRKSKRRKSDRRSEDYK
jgi:CheY-like chemotaxis protein